MAAIERLLHALSVQQPISSWGELKKESLSMALRSSRETQKQNERSRLPQWSQIQPRDALSSPHPSS